MNAVAMPSPQSSRRTLALVVGALMLPFALGAGLYFSGWQPGRAGNRGELLQPPAALPFAAFATPGGEPLAAGETGGKWLLVLAVPGACDPACATRIDEMRRIQVSLNKEMGRLRRLVLAADAADPAVSAARQAQPDLLVAAPAAAWPPVFAAATAPRLYVADPQGNLILRYGSEVSAKDVRTDLDRLLKFAWTG